jgi:hypothetical protein
MQTRIALTCPSCGIYLDKIDCDMTRLMKAQLIECRGNHCYQKFDNPYYVGFFSGLFSSRKDLIIQILNKLAIEEKEQIELKERQRIDQERKKLIKEEKIAAYQKKLNESYFIEDNGDEKPYSLKKIKSLLSSGEIKLSTKIKYGYETDKYLPVFSFEELNQDFKDFL